MYNEILNTLGNSHSNKNGSIKVIFILLNSPGFGWFCFSDNRALMQLWAILHSTQKTLFYLGLHWANSHALFNFFVTISHIYGLLDWCHTLLACHLFSMENTFSDSRFQSHVFCTNFSLWLFQHKLEYGYIIKTF